jgi:hypothetical protein
VAQKHGESEASIILLVNSLITSSCLNSYIYIKNALQMEHCFGGGTVPGGSFTTGSSDGGATAGSAGEAPDDRRPGFNMRLRKEIIRKEGHEQ